LSHQPERKEKNCLNCGATVVGRYCHVCGQENVETKESFWSLAKHFVYDIFHFDGKFFYTLKYLFTRPGWVAREYCLGRRGSFLHPIRMYLFTSAIFFLVFFSVNNINFGKGSSFGKLTTKERMEMAGEYQTRLKKHPEDTSAPKIIALLTDTSKVVTGEEVADMDKEAVFSFQNSNYHSLAEYDSIQKTLPASDRDGWFRRMLVKKSLRFNEKYKGRANEGLKIFWESFIHRLPYMLFLSLPFFALVLKLLYTRRKNFYYSDHAIFTIYHYVFSFILLLLIFGVNAIQSKLDWGFFSFLIMALLISWPIYLLLEMKNFYRQGWIKTIGKFILLNLLGMLSLLLLFVVFLFFSVFEL
jgi:hypothetical protein